MPDILTKEHWENTVIALIHLRAKQNINYNWFELDGYQQAREIIEQTRKYFEERGHILIEPQPTEPQTLIERANDIVENHLKNILDKGITI